MCYTNVCSFLFFSGDVCEKAVRKWGTSNRTMHEMPFFFYGGLLLRLCRKWLITFVTLIWWRKVIWDMTGLPLMEPCDSPCEKRASARETKRRKRERGKRKDPMRVGQKKRPSRGKGRARKRNGLSVKWTSRGGDVLLALMLPLRSASSDLADRHTLQFTALRPEAPLARFFSCYITEVKIILY